MKTSTLKIVSLILISLTIFGFNKEKTDKNRLSKIATNDDNEYINVNQCFMWIGNNGMGSHNPISQDCGFYWSNGEQTNIPAIFADGLVWGAIKNGDTLVNGATYRYGLQAGKILEDGTADDPTNPRYRIYKVRKDWELLADGPSKQAYRKDYEEWPVEDGAPWIDVDNDGKYTVGIDEPEIMGDEMLWCISNDLDSNRSKYPYGSLPIGLEIETSVFGFEQNGAFGDMLFKKYKITNKSGVDLKDMYFSYWSDPDLGYAGDDYVGCDTTLNLAYAYNGDNDDEDYFGENPPAQGYVFLSVKNNFKEADELMSSYLGIIKHAYVFPIDPILGEYEGTIEFYEMMKGLNHDGSLIFSPLDGKPIKKTLSGDPVVGTGWYEGDGWPMGAYPSDRREMMSTGPYNLLNNQSQEIILGIILARGLDNINSISELRKKTKKAIVLAKNDFNPFIKIYSPEVNVFSDNNQITLYWNDNIESYDVVDNMISLDLVEDSTYTFEGYFVKQFSDMEGSDAKIIAEFDKQNDINILVNDKKSLGYYYEELFYELNNMGVERSITISRDSLNETNLRNSNPYYFAVTAFAVSEYSSPKFIESDPIIIEIFPGSNPTDIDLNGNKAQDILIPKSITGSSSADIKVEIVDPTKLTGDKYQIQFNKTTNDEIEYSLTNVNTSEILLSNMNDILFDTLNEFREHYLANLGEKQIVDGFKLYVRDLGKEIPIWLGTQYAVDKVLEVKGPDGKELDTLINVEENLNSSGKWKVKAQGASRRYNWQVLRKQEGLGYDFYEIRFTERGSDFFASGYSNPNGTLKTLPRNDDIKGTGKVPFEVWNIGRTIDDPSDDKRLIVKIMDNIPAKPDSTINDNQWSQLPSGNWEEIYCYEDSLLDPDNLPEQSGTSDYTSHKFGALVFCGEMPEEGTVIRLYSAIPLMDGDIFEITMPSVNLNSKEYAKTQLNTINVFPNPYYAAHTLEWSTSDRFVRFINLPKKAIIRIFNLGGTFIQKIEKDDNSDFVDWNLRNKHDRFIASGLYLAYIEIPQVGTKVLKLAVIQEDK